MNVMDEEIRTMIPEECCNPDKFSEEITKNLERALLYIEAFKEKTKEREKLLQLRVEELQKEVLLLRERELKAEREKLSDQKRKMAMRKRKDGSSRVTQEESSPISLNQQSNMAKSKRNKKGKNVIPSGGQPNPNYEKRLEANFKRKILMERGINMEELADTFVMEELGRLEWHTFVTMRNQCNEQMVRQFYAAMIPSVFEQGGPVFVRGKNVYISPKDINDWLGTKSYEEFEDGYQNEKDYKMYNLNLAKVIQDNPNPQWCKGTKLTQRQLGFRQHFWNIFFSYSLIPAKHRNSVSLEMAIILYCMSKKLKFDVGTLIHRRMVEIGKKKSTVLAFPCLITHFMEKAKLRVDDPADGIKSPHMCERKAYNEAAGPRGVLKLLTEAEQRAEKRMLEKEAVAAERGEDSEEVESEDLEDSDDSEDET